ncbi:MAG: DUF4326 domain-containing protein [Candidatus Peribacteraceae bacterium]|nr:DUF4326 domain-containing protein [Candidatus Peribacteraceae bacterium]
MSKVVLVKNLKRCKPSKPYDVRVDRGFSVLSNDFNMMGDERNRDKVCDQYRVWFKKRVGMGTPEVKIALNAIKHKLKKYGKVRLFCWCAPKRCHILTIREYLLDGIW